MLRSLDHAGVTATQPKQPAAVTAPTYVSSIKPAADRVAALAGLIILAPLLAIIAAVVLCASGRPILFRQQRIGHHFRPFTIVKFRTMRDNKVTGIGGILRQTGLDELPQLWNILRGDMSWIGPRPLTEQDIQRLGWQRPYYRRRWHAKPGITGLAQLYGGVGRKVTWLCDQAYIRNTSAFADAKILLASLLICILGKRRVRRRIYQGRRKNIWPVS